MTAAVEAPLPYRGGCVKGMPLPREDRPSCRENCLHRALVQDFRDARHAWEENRECGAAMQMEDDEYREAYPPPTFKDWLIGTSTRSAPARERVA